MKTKQVLKIISTVRALKNLMTAFSSGTIFLILLLVFINAFFVTSEFAYVRIRPSRILELLASGSKSAKKVDEIVNNLDKSMSSTQLGITLASIALGFVAEPYFSYVIESLFYGIDNLFHIGIFSNVGIIDAIGFFAGYMVVTFMHVVLGELAPKSAAIRYAERAAVLCAYPFYYFMKLTDPLLRFFVFCSDGFLKLIHIPITGDTHSTIYSEEEIKIIIGDSIKKGEIEEYESKLIFNILDFTDTMARQILTPRNDVKALPNTSMPKDFINLSIETGLSRIPVYEEEFDNINFFVHIKDVLKFSTLYTDQPEKFNIKKFSRKVIKSPETKRIDELLKEMQKEKTQMAIIYDEYGNVEGLITIEDIVEAIFGPIKDEFDLDLVSEEIEILDNSLIAGGLVTLSEFNKITEEKYNINIESEESVTLAGYVLELFKSEIPSESSEVTDDYFKYKILKIKGTRIERIEVTKLP